MEYKKIRAPVISNVIHGVTVRGHVEDENGGNKSPRGFG
jgi:hypothetical protein